MLKFLKRAVRLSDEEYLEAIGKGLDRAFDHAISTEVELSKLKVVVFSDLHRGARDGADDFERCERAYASALGWYLERGFELWLLGDVEELWENDIDEVMPRYGDLLELEQEFRDRTGFRRFYGNHDLDWRDPKRVAKHLPGLEIVESLRLTVLHRAQPLGLLFLAHGHQGTLLSDRWAGLSRIGIRRVWRPLQRAHRFLSTTPAEDGALRHRHDVAMYQWAKRRVIEGREGERPVLIAGHTHHPVFPNDPPNRPNSSDLVSLEHKLADLPPALRPDVRAKLELTGAELREKSYSPPHEMDFPCYFNSGCCCFPDRDVTCLQINGTRAQGAEGEVEDEGYGEIRLVRWLDDHGEPRPKKLAALSLREMFEGVAAG